MYEFSGTMTLPQSIWYRTGYCEDLIPLDYG